ncbi:MAG: hypothetical protein CMP21_05730 [Rickettsiales bacterium]|nr:hypothetical protein [Rickettsiales bacterium]|tara:strand:+ start:1548 stop:2684 length:1137 start_codon:yes stop_codon:yes gene_type:complete
MNPFVVILLLFLFFYTPVTAAKKYLTPDAKINKNTQQLISKKGKQKKAQFLLGKLNKDIHSLELTLKYSQKELESAIQDHKKVKRDLSILSKKETELNKAFSKRIRYLYKHSPLSIFDIMLSNDNWIYDTNSQYFFSLIIKKDIALINTIKKHLIAIRAKRTQFLNKTKQILSLQKEKKEYEKTLHKKRTKQAYHIAQLDRDIKRIMKENKELEKLSKYFSTLILKEPDRAYGSGNFIYPVKGWISSKYGNRIHPIFKRKIKHKGIDFAAPKGTPIKAVDSGKVIFAGRHGGYGNCVLIYHGPHPKSKKIVSTFYAHQSRLLVKKGDFLRKGDSIGWVGDTGYATGPHLHFEVKVILKNDSTRLKYVSTVNPINYIPI